jgi:flavin-dependent dehydrogenase
MSEPVTIVGAGPSGLACAIALARSGWRVIVRERHSRVGARFHGDFQGLENWSDAQDVLDELHAAGVSGTFAHFPISKGVVFDHRGREYRVQSARSLYYLIRRGGSEGCLDYDLLQQVIALGVDVRFQDRTRDVPGLAVLAIGPRSPDVIAVGYVFDTDMTNGNWLALDNRLAPLGYSYLLIQDGRGTVASCMFTGFKNQAEYVIRTVEFFRQRAGLRMRHQQPFGGFGNFHLPGTAMQGGHPVVGEQAGFQDALAGFGMRFALRSGLLAAQSIVENTDYTHLWRRKLQPLLRTGVVNRFLYNTLGEGGRLLALRKLSGGDAGAVLRRFSQPSLPAKLLFPIARLRYRAALHDPSCNHIDCQCVWCTCQDE